MKNELFAADHSPYCLVPYRQLHPSEKGLSYFRSSQPDYRFEIKLPFLCGELSSAHLKYFEQVECHFDLNYGDLYLILINSYEDYNPPLSLEINLLNDKLSELKIRLDNFLPTILKEQKKKNCNGPIIIPHKLFTDLIRETNATVAALALCRSVQVFLEEDQFCEISIVNFLLSILGKKYLSHYTPSDIAKEFCSTPFIKDVNVIMRFEGIDRSTYYFEDFIDVVLFDLMEAINNKMSITRCGNCGRFFIPVSRSDEKYCYFKDTSGKTCRDIGYENKVQSDAILRTYRKLYKTQNARKQRNRNNRPDIDSRFHAWAIMAKDYLKRCQRGEISLKDMEEAISKPDWMDNKEGILNGDD